MVVQDVGAAATDDHHVVAAGRLNNHVLCDLEDGSTGVEDRVRVRRAPGGGLRRDHRLGVGGTKGQ